MVGSSQMKCVLGFPTIIVHLLISQAGLHALGGDTPHVYLNCSCIIVSKDKVIYLSLLSSSLSGADTAAFSERFKEHTRRSYV